MEDDFDPMQPSSGLPEDDGDAPSGNTATPSDLEPSQLWARMVQGQSLRPSQRLGGGAASMPAVLREPSTSATSSSSVATAMKELMITSARQPSSRSSQQVMLSTMEKIIQSVPTSQRAMLRQRMEAQLRALLMSPPSATVGASRSVPAAVPAAPTPGPDGSHSPSPGPAPCGFRHWYESREVDYCIKFMGKELGFNKGDNSLTVAEHFVEKHRLNPDSLDSTVIVNRIADQIRTIAPGGGHGGVMADGSTANDGEDLEWKPDMSWGSTAHIQKPSGTRTVFNKATGRMETVVYDRHDPKDPAYIEAKNRRLQKEMEIARRKEEADRRAVVDRLQLQRQETVREQQERRQLKKASSSDGRRRVIRDGQLVYEDDAPSVGAVSGGGGGGGNVATLSSSSTRATRKPHTRYPSWETIVPAYREKGPIRMESEMLADGWTLEEWSAIRMQLSLYQLRQVMGDPSVASMGSGADDLYDSWSDEDEDPVANSAGPKPLKDDFTLLPPLKSLSSHLATSKPVPSAATTATATSPATTAFSGSGHTLASSSTPTGSHTTSLAHPTGESPATTDDESISIPEVTLNEQEPTTTLAITLQSGKRVRAKFNHHVHTVRDVKYWIARELSLNHISFELRQLFPTVVFQDLDATLQDAGMVNVAIVQRKV